MQRIIRRTLPQLKCLISNKTMRLPMYGLLNMSSTFLVQKQLFRFSESQDMEKVSNYENLISRISSADNINDVLKIFKTNENLLKNEHIVLSLRMMARVVRKSHQDELEQLANNETYKNLIQRADASIETLNEYEVLDFLFWMRKFRVARIPLLITQDGQEKFYAKVHQFLKNKSFNFRNLVNLYYDFSFLNRNCDEICGEILKDLRNDVKLLTPFTVIQILQAASKKSISKGNRELILADFVSRNFNNLLEEFDTDQKCVIFKYLSQLELHYNPPKHRIPPVIYQIRTSLKDKLDQLSESSVINLINGYQHLPREFPQDLYDELKEMVVITVQHNSANIKSFFLLDFVENILLTRRRKFDQKAVEILANELGERLLHDEYLQKNKNFERLIGVYDKGIRSEKLKQSFFDYFKGSEQKNINLSLAELLAKSEGIDLNQVLLNQLNQMTLSQINAYQSVRLYILLTFLKNNEGFQEHITQLKGQVDELIEKEPAKVINIIKNSHILYSPMRKELLNQCIKSMASQYSEQKIQNYNFYKNVLQSIERREHRKFWIEWFNQNPELLSQESLISFLDAFSQQEQYTLEQFLVFLNLVQQDGFKKINLRKLLFIMKGNTNFINEFLKFENLFKRLCSALTQLCEKQPENIRLQYIYSFAQRIEGSGHRSIQFSKFLKKAFENSQHEKLSQQIEFVFGILLIQHGELSLQHAKSLFEKNKERLSDINLRAQIFSYILSHENQEFLDLPDTQAEVNKIIEGLQKNIKEGTSFKVLHALTSSLALPLSFIQKDSEFYLKNLKEYIPQANSQQYLQLILALNPKYVKPNYQQYHPVIKELINSYANYNKKLQFHDLVRILQKFSSINCKHPNIYNSILTDIGNNFLSMSPDERIKCMQSFAQMKIKQVDFFQKNIENIAQNFNFYRRYLNNIVQSLYAVGYDNQASIKDLLKIAEEIIHDKDISETFNLVKYLLVLKPENEKVLLDQYLGKFTENDINEYQKFKNRGEFLLVHEIITREYKNEIFSSKVGQVLDQAKISELRAKYFSKTPSIIKNIDMITSYLGAMKVDFNTDLVVDGIQVDLAVPQQNILIKIAQTNDVNFDKFSYNGRIILYKRLYEVLQGDKNKALVLNFIEFLNQPDHQSRVNYLIQKGIQSNVQNNQYDFSAIKITKKESSSTSSESDGESSMDEKDQDKEAQKQK